MIDLTGQRFGALVAVRPVSAAETSDHRPGWLCRCDCGRQKVVNGGNLRAGRITSCGCHLERGRRRSLTPNSRPIVDYTGQTFYELTAVRRVGSGTWLFRCSCGQEITARAAFVRSGAIQSCGHVLRETARRKADMAGDNVLEFYDGTSVSRLRRLVSSPVVHGIRTVRTADGGTVYVARLVLRGKQIYLGRFASYDDAVRARREAERVYYLPIIEAFDCADKDKEDNHHG